MKEHIWVLGCVPLEHILPVNRLFGICVLAIFMTSALSNCSAGFADARATDLTGWQGSTPRPTPGPVSDSPDVWVDDSGPCVRNAATVMVSPGQSLQVAIKGAKPGTVIKVKPGRYAGCLDLGGVHGANGNPILLISEKPGAAELVGDPTCAVISAGISKGGVSNVGIYGFTIVANTESGDLGGVKIAGPWTNPAHNIALVQNTVTGQGQDGVKFFNGARDLIIAGNAITGSWRQEAFDNVSVERAVFVFNSTSGALARYTSVTIKGASRDIELYSNDFNVKARDVTFRPTQVSVGGYGDYRRLKQPNYWAQPFQAKRVNIHDNIIGGPNAIVFAAGIDSIVQHNSFAGTISYSCGRDTRFNAAQILCSSSANNTIGINAGPGGPVGPSALPLKTRVCPGSVAPLLQ